MNIFVIVRYTHPGIPVFVEAHWSESDADKRTLQLFKEQPQWSFIALTVQLPAIPKNAILIVPER